MYIILCQLEGICERMIKVNYYLKCEIMTLNELAHHFLHNGNTAAKCL